MSLTSRTSMPSRSSGSPKIHNQYTKKQPENKNPTPQTSNAKEIDRNTYRISSSQSSKDDLCLSPKTLALLMAHRPDPNFKEVNRFKRAIETALGRLSKRELTELFNEVLLLKSEQAFSTLFSYTSSDETHLKVFKEQLNDSLAKLPLAEWILIYKNLPRWNLGDFLAGLFAQHSSKKDLTLSAFINGLNENDLKDVFSFASDEAHMLERFFFFQKPETFRKFLESLDEQHFNTQLTVFEALIRLKKKGQQTLLENFFSLKGGKEVFLKKMAAFLQRIKLAGLSSELCAFLKQEALDTVRKLKSSLLEGLEKDIMKFLIPDDFEDLETILKLSESQEEVPPEFLLKIQRFAPFKGILESLKYASTLFSVLPIEDSFSTLLQEFEELFSLKVEDKHLKKYLNEDSKTQLELKHKSSSWKHCKSFLQKNLDRAVDALLISFSKRLDPKKQIALLSHKFPENISPEVVSRFEEITYRGLFKLASLELSFLFEGLAEADNFSVMEKLFSSRITVRVLDGLEGYKNVEETLSTEQKVEVLTHLTLPFRFESYKEKIKLFIKQQIQALPEEERQNFLIRNNWLEAYLSENGP